MKNNLTPEIQDHEDVADNVNPYLSLHLADPATGLVHDVELLADGTLIGMLNRLVDDGLAAPLRAALAALPPDLPWPARNLASFVLFLLECNIGAYAEAAERGLAMNAAGTMPKVAQLHVALALNYAGRPDEAYDFLAGTDRPTGDYQLACCASRFGNYEVALDHLIRAIKIDPASVVSRIPIDVDFAPMWEHFAKGAATIRECAMLRSPLLDLCWQETAGFDKPGSYLDHFDYARLPERLRPAVKANVGLFVYRARVAGDRGYDVDLATELAEFLARDAADRLAASQTAVNAAAIPLQMLLAADGLAESGDIMHARWGLLHLAKDYPNTVSDIGVSDDNQNPA
jgi:tetratricopeptide (TPR) repeat protein